MSIIVAYHLVTPESIFGWILTVVIIYPVYLISDLILTYILSRK